MGPPKKERPRIKSVSADVLWRRKGYVFGQGERKGKGVSEHALFGLTLDAGLYFHCTAHKHTSSSDHLLHSRTEGTLLRRKREKSEGERLCLGPFFPRSAPTALSASTGETKRDWDFVFQPAKNYSFSYFFTPHKICFSLKPALCLSWELFFVLQTFNFIKWFWKQMYLFIK